ncbi:sensor histidine kinase [Allorhizocola rhizosphaerae]|uniref:sensor histidine kinase n=1 Tax=Allorhizocola rhizosphaerae TaxID=1872709 RepID=UPI0013C3663C|nr:HAMP domain-containing sensor histidine kinase [Allorhizocola rhizosphaerae]
MRAVLSRAPREQKEPGWFGLARHLRSRLLLSYLCLIVLCGGLAVVGLREVLVSRLEDRVSEAIRQEFQEVNRLLSTGVDPRTGLPFRSLAAAIDVFLDRNVPSNEEAFVVFIPDRSTRVSLDRFPLRELPGDVMARIAASAPGRIGTFETDLGLAYYGAQEVSLGERTGLFVVTILPVSEHGEIVGVQTYGVFVVAAIVLVASAFAWLLTGRLLVPVRQLTQTARLISQSEQSQRIPIPVRGSDEAAEMARTFNAMMDRLELVLRKQREFILDASHELRGPLTICMGHLGLLEHGVVGDDPLERSETIALVTDELERMGRIVEDLRLLADIAQPDFLRLESIDLHSFTHELAGKLSSLAHRMWTVDDAATGAVLGDRHRLTQAVVNLAQNAVHHTSSTDTIALATSRTGDEWRISVRDTGSGIAEADLVRIFERFQRGAQAHRRYRGSGLGLAIVRALVQAHGGRVEVTSRPGGGSTFVLVLPAAPRKDHEPWRES